MENTVLELGLLVNDMTLDNELDMLDELLDTLPVIEPPTNFVARIMHAVSALPEHQPALVSPWGDLDQMLVLCDRNRLS